MAAEDDAASDQSRDASITVTATRAPIKLEDAPATVTVISDTQIADMLVTDIKDLVRFEPGVSVRRGPARFGAALGATGRAGNEGFTIRGIGGNRVLIQVDGIRTPQGYSFGAQDAGRGGYTDVGLIKSVEILRGPASALYGSDGLAGAVSFTTSDPEDLLRPGQDVGGFGRVQYSSADNEWAETIAAAGRAGNFSVLLAYTRRDFQELENQGTVDGIGATRTLPNPQDGQSDAVLGKLVYTDGGHRVRLTGELLRTNVFSNVLSGEGPSGLGWNVDQLTAEDRTRRGRVSADWSWQGEGVVDYAHVAGYWQNGQDIQFSDEDRSPSADRERLNTFENRVWGLSAEGRSDFATGALGHRLSFGGDISWTEQKGLRDGVAPPAGETFPSSAFPKTDFMLGGVFLGDEISIADGLVTLFPALRFDFYRLEPQDDLLYPAASQAGQEDSRLSPKFGAVVNLGHGIRLFGNYAQGFRAPTPSQVNNFFGNIAYGYTSEPNPDLGPERSESWEGGVRYTGNGFSLSATYFKADYEDFISQEVVSGSFTPADPAIYKYINLGQVEISGVEAKGDFTTGFGLTGRAAIAYADGKKIAANGSKSPLDTIDPLTIVGGLGYRDPGGVFGTELIVTHNSGKSAEDAVDACNRNLCYIPPASTVLDLTAFVKVTDALTIRGGIFNLTDETYALWSDVRGLTQHLPTTTDTVNPTIPAYTRPGRNGSVSISYRF
ncbi:TonB-dependent hemoglobin/transferrin/lactoferrin family receptor [Croceibacterium xixiisoli]|nr:TonB-dependent hemoglobin/transferrin/lactoferrin family receptor [Croceibacterium xixiisoli]